MVSKLFSFFRGKGKKVEVQIVPAIHKDLIGYLKANKKYFVRFESKILSKSSEEVEKEFDLGFRILNLDFKEDFKDKKTIIFIPQKYELWPHLFLGIKLVKIGYNVHFLYFGWAKKIIKLISSRTNYVDYQNLKFSDIDDYHIDDIKDSFFINMSESFDGIKTTVPSFSTVYLKKGCDLDYATAFIVDHAFSFAGLKKSSIKRVILDKGLESEFLRKIQLKLNFGKTQNSSLIKSSRTMDEIREIVSEAISDGAELHAGDAIINSEELPKNILLSDVRPEMRIFQKKFFGPVLLVTSISKANSSLSQVLNMQPSNGIVVFVKNSGEKIVNLPDKFEYAYRTANKDMNLDLLHDHPSLEYLLNQLKR